MNSFMSTYSIIIFIAIKYDEIIASIDGMKRSIEEIEDHLDHPSLLQTNRVSNTPLSSSDDGIDDDDDDVDELDGGSCPFC